MSGALAGWPAPLREAAEACARGECPANVALMRMALAAESAEAFLACLARLEATLGDPPDGAEAARLAALCRLARTHPDAWRTIRAVADAVDHRPSEASPERLVARAAAAFDRAAALSPEASVALYALGDPGLLAAATGEVIERLLGWGLLGPGQRVLDLGCGIGRLLVPLAREVGGAGTVVGIDVSPAMVEAARRRAEGHANVRVLQGSGLDLAPVGDGAIDLVLAVDSFPYLVQADLALAARHVGEAARVLGPGGSLVILNFSYRGDPAGDAQDVARLGRAAGLVVRRSGERAFSLWDGVAYELVRPET